MIHLFKAFFISEEKENSIAANIKIVEISADNWWV